LEDTSQGIISVKHYKALLLLYASHADLDYSDDERQYIINQVGEEVTAQVEVFFEEKSEFEVLSFLVSNRSQFMPGDDGRERALSLLKSLFKSDGDFSSIELNSLQFLEKMFYSDGSSSIDV